MAANAVEATAGRGLVASRAGSGFKTDRAGYDRSLDDAARRYAAEVEREAAEAGGPARNHAEAAEPASGADTARNALVTAAMPFADRLAAGYRGRGVPLDDLQQVARLALIKAIDHLDPRRGSFTAYAAITVRGELRRHFRDTAWDVRVPRATQELTLDVWRATDELTGELSRAPTRTEVARRLHVGADSVGRAELAAGAYSARSLNAPVQTDEPAAELGDVLGGPDRDLETVDDRVTVRALVERLPARERRILALRFYGNRNQNEIAQACGLSQMHVSRLLTRTLTWLRAAMLRDEVPPWPSVHPDPDLPAGLPVAVSCTGGVVTVAPAGEVDQYSAPALRAVLRWHCRRARHGVHVDLRRLSFLDAAGVAALAAGYREAHRRGIEFCLVNASATVVRGIRVAGLGGLLADPPRA